MSAERRSPSRTDKRISLNKEDVEIGTKIVKLKHDRAVVRRDEFDEMSKALRQLQKNTDDLATQLTRISQMQMEIDGIKRVLAKAKLTE